MDNLGIIDIGSNTICMIIVQVHPDGAFKLANEIKESVRLGEQLNEDNLLDLDKMNYAIETLRFFLDLKYAYSVKSIICVATEAVRRAKNYEVFLKMAKDRLDLDIRILTGIEEAYYDYLAAVNTLILPDCLIMDIGGRSTELIRVEKNKISDSISIPIGSITISQRLQLKNISGLQGGADMMGYIKDQFKEIEWINGVDTLVGIGGSFRNVAKVDQRRKKYPLDIIHNYTMGADDLREIHEMMLPLSIEERIKIKGLSADRADIMPGALTVITALLDLTGIRDIIISGAGLREGLCYDRLLGEKQPVKDVFGFSIQNVIRHYGINENHALQVWKIAQQLYQQLQKELKIDRSQFKVLMAAALLHDSGINISYYDHHRHTFYEIMNSHLNGISHKELLMAAWAASMHRKCITKIAALYKMILSDEEIQTVKQLGVLLRIAESLDRRQNGNIYKIKCSFDPDEVKISVFAKKNPYLELKDAYKALAGFYKIFQRRLVFEFEER